MKSIATVNMAAIVLLFGMPAPLHAKQEKPTKQEERAKPPQHQAGPEKQQPRAKPHQEQQRQQRPKPQENSANHEQQGQVRQEPQHQHQQPSKPANQQQRSQASQHQDQQQRAHGRNERPGNQHAANHQRQQDRSQRPHRTQQAIARQHAQPALRLSARGGGRISDAHFHSNFGREHRFRIGNPVLVGGYSRFRYGGYWFGFVEPWPTGWYYTDDVYIDYVDDGYYMYDPYYPGTRFAISVVL